MLLKQSVDLMLSDDYRDRFAAELLQLHHRHLRLTQFLLKIKSAELGLCEMPEHDCPVSLLQQQSDHMDAYLTTLRIRAAIERVHVPGIVILLPGDTVYVVDDFCEIHAHVVPDPLSNIDLYKHLDSNLGTTVFFAREDAESRVALVRGCAADV